MITPLLETIISPPETVLSPLGTVLSPPGTGLSPTKKFCPLQNRSLPHGNRSLPYNNRPVPYRDLHRGGQRLDRGTELLALLQVAAGVTVAAGAVADDAPPLVVFHPGMLPHLGAMRELALMFLHGAV